MISTIFLRHTCVLLLLIILAVIPMTAIEAAEEQHYGAWGVQTSVDRMSGNTSVFVFTYSKNTLRGWLRKGKVLFGYSCGGNFYARAHDLGFHIDTYIDGRRVQYARIKFDQEPPENLSFNVWEDNIDGMSFRYDKSYLSELLDRAGKSHLNGLGDRDVLMHNMKAGSTVLLEVTLFSTDGEPQIAEFDLNGFTAAVEQCPHKLRSG